MADLTPHGSRSVILTVAQVVDETADARSIVFEVPASMGEKFTDYEAGQFLTLRIPSDQTGSVARCYSLSSSPSTDDQPKVTVKRTPDGYGSNWVCDNLEAGSQIEALPPSGVFTPANLHAPLLLIAAGSGVTPVMSILKTALKMGTGPVTFFYANRSEDDVIFAAELRELHQANPGRLTVVHWLETLQGLPGIRALATFFKPMAGSHSAYICGPGPFMDAVHEGLAKAKFDHHNVHTEVYNSLAGDPFVDVEHEAVTEEEGRCRGAGGGRAGRADAQPRLATQPDADRHHAGRGARRTLLLPGGRVRFLRLHAVGGDRGDGELRCTRSRRHRRRLYSRLPGASDVGQPQDRVLTYAGSMTSDRLARILSLILLVPGVLHFLTPKPFDSIVPNELPGEPRYYTYASGVAEVGLGAAVLVPSLRRRAAGLAAVLFAAVFPANVNMVRLWQDKGPAMKTIALARLPLQIPLIALAIGVWRRSGD